MLKATPTQPCLYRVEVVADTSSKWCSNGLRFAAAREAENYARDLADRWLLVERWRVVREDPSVDVIVAEY